jgi:hypothetical protein
MLTTIGPTVCQCELLLSLSTSLSELTLGSAGGELLLFIVL